MKALASVIASLALPASAGAVEFITLFPNETKDLDPTSLIEITARNNNSASSGHFTIFKGESAYQEINVIDSQDRALLIATGITRVATSNVTVVTLKITPASEVNAIGPTTVLVLPENSSGNYDIVLDSSNDLVNWTTFHSQTVTAPAADNFYRARIVKTPSP